MNLEVVCSSLRVDEFLLAVLALEYIADDSCRMEALLISFEGQLVEEILAADDAGPDIIEWVHEDLLCSRYGFTVVSRLSVHPSHVPT